MCFVKNPPIVHRMSYVTALSLPLRFAMLLSTFLIVLISFIIIINILSRNLGGFYRYHCPFHAKLPSSLHANSGIFLSSESNIIDRNSNYRTRNNSVKKTTRCIFTDSRDTKSVIIISANFLKFSG